MNITENNLKNMSAQGKKYQLLMMEDDKFLLNMYSIKFEKLGFEVTPALTGAEALRKIQEGYIPNIMLCDLVMPGMSGLEFLETIRRDKLVPKAVVVVLSNQSDSPDIAKAMSLGAHGYIVKATKIPSEVVAEVLKIAKAQGI